MNKQTQEFRAKILQYIHQLESTSFDGWSKDAIAGYKTACISIKYKVQNYQKSLYDKNLKH